MSTPQASTQWFHAIAVCGPVLPSLISFFFQSLTIPLFTPRQLINDNNLWSFLFGIWASPASFSGHLSRALQAALVLLLPTSTLQYYALWLLTAALRTGVGQLLTRVVGWAAPQFFSHWALYEVCGGYGPSIIIYAFLCGISPNATKFFYQRSSQTGDLVLLVCLCALLCVLDDGPWTYGVAVVGAGAIALALWIFRMITSRSFIPHPMLPDGQKQAAALKLKAILGTMVLALFGLTLPYGIRYQMAPFVPTDMPSSPTSGSPLLEILILSFPRPNAQVSTQIMATTINSFVPYLDSNVALSVFTHATSHPSFDDVRKIFASTNITFYTDGDTHLDYTSGQYLHIAEAFRWVIERPNRAEWVMLVEDDFPICGGDRGWDGVKKVMQILEARSGGREAIRNRQGAFIGTGGSGLIIHRTMLPVLVLLMRTHAEIASKLPPTSNRRPADVVMQDCLLGTDPLCTQEGGKLVITSRLIMDHIGGMVTTNMNKALNDDKWRCGWRHAFHGNPRVEVVVI